MSQRAQAEILHLENLLQLRSTSVQELTIKVNSLQKSLNRSTSNATNSQTRSLALETRIEEIAQLLQIITSDRDSCRSDCVRHTETINIQTQEREEMVKNHSQSLQERTELINRLHAVIKEDKDKYAQLERTNVEQHTTITHAERQAKEQEIAISKLKEELLEEQTKSKESQDKLKSILQIIQ